MAIPTYVTREDLASSLDVKASAYMSAQLDHKCASATSAVNGALKRLNLYPVTKTRYFDWPNSQDSGPSRIYFDDDPIVSLATLTSGGVTIPASAYFLEPAGQGPPFDYLELDRSQSYFFAGSSTTQHAVAMAGVWASAAVTEDSISTLFAAVVSTSAATISVTTPAGGVGSLIRVDSERMIITDKTWAAPTQTVTNVAGLIAAPTDTTLTVSDTSTYVAGEVLLIDAERLVVREIVDATAIIVGRAWDGTALAIHATGASVRRQLTLRVQRGAVGTTAATHLISAPVLRWQIPPLAGELALAYAEDALLQGNSGYARTVGSGESERQYSARGIRELEQRVIAVHGRTARFRAV